MTGGDVTVVAGGWSVRNVALDCLCGRVIAVNESALLLPRWDACVSMDRLWTEHRMIQLMLRSREEHPPREVWLRVSAVQNFSRDFIKQHHWIKEFYCDHELSEFSDHPSILNGTNSGACALNLAWKWMPDRLFLLGFDMCRDKDGRAYWHDDYPWAKAGGGTGNGKYADWARQLEVAADYFRLIKCEVFNVSPGSRITAFTKISPAQYLKECRSR